MHLVEILDAPSPVSMRLLVRDVATSQKRGVKRPLLAMDRVGRGNLSIFLHSTARENSKLMTNGSLTIPIAQMALPLATPVAYLNELGNPGRV